MTYSCALLGGAREDAHPRTQQTYDYNALPFFNHFQNQLWGNASHAFHASQDQLWGKNVMLFLPFMLPRINCDGKGNTFVAFYASEDQLWGKN